MDDLYNLEFLSLVAKITQEVENHTGMNDKTLAEFVIDLHEQSKSNLSVFKTKLKEVGAEFPDSFVENVDRLILSMHPKHKKKNAKTVNGVEKGKEAELTEKEKQRRLLPGLALADREVPAPVPDDVFLKELGDIVAGKKVGPRPSVEERSPKRQRRSHSPPRGRSYESSRHNNGSRKAPLDERPVLYKIYNGRISGMKEFGAFVTLEGIAGRVEGMFHLQLALPIF
jgi:ATP-dependent RNA helicase DHX8/PRP22